MRHVSNILRLDDRVRWMRGDVGQPLDIYRRKVVAAVGMGWLVGRPCDVRCGWNSCVSPTRVSLLLLEECGVRCGPEICT